MDFTKTGRTGGRTDKMTNGQTGLPITLTDIGTNREKTRVRTDRKVGGGCLPNPISLQCSTYTFAHSTLPAFVIVLWPPLPVEIISPLVPFVFVRPGLPSCHTGFRRSRAPPYIPRACRKSAQKKVLCRLKSTKYGFTSVYEVLFAYTPSDKYLPLKV